MEKAPKYSQHTLESPPGLICERYTKPSIIALLGGDGRKFVKGFLKIFFRQQIRALAPVLCKFFFDKTAGSGQICGRSPEGRSPRKETRYKQFSGQTLIIERSINTVMDYGLLANTGRLTVGLIKVQ
jgi:hypothetical protein